MTMLYRVGERVAALLFAAVAAPVAARAAYTPGFVLFNRGMGSR
jgi:hypothetical protein